MDNFGKLFRITILLSILIGIELIIIIVLSGQGVKDQAEAAPEIGMESLGSIIIWMSPENVPFYYWIIPNEYVSVRDNMITWNNVSGGQNYILKGINDTIVIFRYLGPDQREALVSQLDLSEIPCFEIKNRKE